jgi:RNA polymerase sigma-70 factor (family 1)
LQGSQPYEEKALLERISLGDEKAFSQFVSPLFDRLYGFSLSVTKSEMYAEEIVQDTFLKIWQHRSELQELDNVTAWIFTITRNLSYNFLKRQLKDQELVRRLDEYFALPSGSAEENLLYKEALVRVQQAVNILPPQQAMVFTLNRLQGLSLDEVADQLQLSKSTVKNHLTQALKNVRTHLLEHSGIYMLVMSALLWENL